MTNSKQSPVLNVSDDTQVSCIDLPGEPIRCVRTKPKLRVVLRKHRDVVFDIKLGSGSYTVEANQSNFYSERDSKLILPGNPVQFQDGERLHLWVARTFAGKLLLKRNGTLISTYEPNKIDPYTCTSENPEGKPAPLIVSIQLPSVASAAAQRPRSVSTEQIEDMQTMHVIEVKNLGTEIPKQLLDFFFASGGEETAIDANGVVTRNWLLGQLVGAGVYGLENQKWIRELNGQKFYLKKRIRKSGEAVYDVIFTGNHRIRELLKGTRYLADNPAVLAITNGAGTANGIRHAAWNATKNTFKKLGAVGIVFSITTDVAEWLADYGKVDPVTGEPKTTIFKLMSKVGVNLVKIGITAAVTSAAMAGLGLLFTAAFVSALPVIAIVAGTIGVTIVVSYGIDFIDKNWAISHSIERSIRNQTTYLLGKYPKDYFSYDAFIQSDFGWGIAP